MRTFVTAIFEARHGKAGELERVLRGLVEPTFKDEGCLFYALHRDQDDPNRLVFIEEWESREALDAHNETEHLKAAFTRMEADGLVENRHVAFLERIAGGDVKS